MSAGDAEISTLNAEAAGTSGCFFCGYLASNSLSLAPPLLHATIHTTLYYEGTF
jgi:hypothetical protein